MKFITSQVQAAKFLGINPRTVRRLIRKGEFPEPVQKTPCKAGNGGFYRVWTVESLWEIREKMEERQKHNPLKSVLYVGI